MTVTDFYNGFQAVLTGMGIKHFTARGDFTARRGEASVPPTRLWENMIPTVRMAQRARDEFGPLIVNSAYRELSYNRRIKSSDGSLHVQFSALDLAPTDDVTPAELHRFFLAQDESLFMGIGLYDTFVHIDYRGSAARWNG